MRRDPKGSDTLKVINLVSLYIFLSTFESCISAAYMLQRHQWELALMYGFSGRSSKVAVILKVLID